MGKRNLQQKIFYILLLLITLVVVMFVFGIIFYLIYKGVSSLSWEFLTEFPSNGMREGGILPAIIGTLYLVIGTIIFALPIGVFAAIYI